MGESWAHDSAAPEQQTAEPAPPGLPPQGLAGYVVQLQGLVGNRAVSQALARASGRELQRKVDIFPADLGGVGTVGKRHYLKIKKTLAAYHRARDPAVQGPILVRIDDLIKAWKEETSSNLHPATLQRFRELTRLEAEIATELSNLPQTQADYKQRHQQYEQDALTSLQPGTQPRPFTRRSPQDPAAYASAASTPESKEAAKWAREELGLDDAEILAIRIYSLADYGYINPASVKAPARKPGPEGWERWMRYGIKESEGDPSFDPMKLSNADIKAADAEGRRHGKVVKDALAKLPPWKGTVYRGLRLEKEDFKDLFVKANDELVAETFWSTSAKREEPEEKFAVPKPGRPVSVLLKLRLRTGRDIRRISLVGKEDEVLVLPGTRFRITSILPADPPHPTRKGTLAGASFWDVKAEELPSHRD